MVLPNGLASEPVYLDSCNLLRYSVFNNRYSIFAFIFHRLSLGKFPDMMRPLFLAILACFMLFTGFKSEQSEPEFVCMKTHKASNTCHFNFKVDGAKYRYVDIGCKYQKKVDELVQKAKDGTIALSKDWKIECPQPKEQPASDH
jgi:hypothetical protein